MFQWIPAVYVLYLVALIMQNAILAANDKAVLSIGIVSRWWFALIVILLTLLLEHWFVFFQKKVEDM